MRFSFDEVGGAIGLIRPVQASETKTGATWSVTGDLLRWDDVAAPPLSVRGFGHDHRADGAELRRQSRAAADRRRHHHAHFDGAPPPPAAASFRRVHGGGYDTTAPKRNLSFGFASVAALLAEFATAGAPVVMGDRNADGIADAYLPSTLHSPRR